MQRRQADEFQRLDVSASVVATVQALGYPSFRYKPVSKVPEYLVLIDRASFRDHRAQLFETLTTALKDEGLYVTTFFYDGDPRLCSDAHGCCFPIEDLQNKRAGHRLLIFGDGEKLIDPLTGELESWASFFSFWQDCALLSPEADGVGGLREEVLSSQFIIVPANLNGLLNLLDYLERPIAWQPAVNDRRARLDAYQTIQQLRDELGEATFQWLCACAIYPELQWGLTLYVGSLPCMGPDLIKEENLARLAALPWFRNGAIPDQVRLSLIRQLDKEKAQAIREAIIALLERPLPARRTPQVDSADAYELNLAVQSWFWFLDEQNRYKLRKVVVNLPRKKDFNDYTLLRFLESAPKTRLAMLLPERLRKLLYANALPEFGLKTGVRFTMTLAVIVAIGAGLNWLTRPAPKMTIRGFAASQQAILVGEPVSFWYGVSNAAQVRITPEPGEVPPLEENVLVVEPTKTTVYRLTATDHEGREVSRQLTVEVVPETALRLVSFAAEPASVVAGEATNLCYEVRNVVGCKLVSDAGEVLEDWKADEAIQVLPMRQNCIPVAPDKEMGYTLLITATDGSTLSRSITVDVAGSKDLRILSFQAESPMITEGDSTRLCFQVSNAMSVQIAASSGESVAINNNCSTVRPTQTMVYTLKATGEGGQQQRQSLTVRVVPNAALQARISEVAELVRKGADALQAGNLIEPARESAYFYAQEALALDRQNAQALAVYKQVKDTLVARAEEAYGRGEMESALVQLEQVIRLFPDDKVLLQRADDLRAQAAAVAAKVGDPNTRRIQGLEKYRRGEYPSAIPDLEFAVVNGQVSSDVLFALAHSYMRTGQLDKAVLYFQRIQPSADDLFRSALAELGDIAREQGDLDGALQKYKQARQLGGSALYAIGKLDDTINKIEKRQRERAEEPIPITIRAKHIHGGVFGGSCSGTLSITSTGVRYDGSEHVFSANLLAAGVKLTKEGMEVKLHDRIERFIVERKDAERFNETLSRFQKSYLPSEK